MKASSLRRLERLAEMSEDVPELKDLPWQDLKVVADLRQRFELPKASLAMQMLANASDDPKELAEFRDLCDPTYDIVRESNAELLKFRDELRKLWVGKPGEQIAIMEQWWHRYNLDRHNGFWNVFDLLGTFYPTKRNFRATVGRICVGNLQLLARCANPECARFFVKKRRDQKFCLEEDCLRYGSRQRANKYWRGTHAKRSKKGR